MLLMLHEAWKTARTLTHPVQLAVWPTASAMAAALCGGAEQAGADSCHRHEQHHDAWLSQFSYLPAALRTVSAGRVCHTSLVPRLSHVTLVTHRLFSSRRRATAALPKPLYPTRDCSTCGPPPPPTFT